MCIVVITFLTVLALLQWSASSDQNCRFARRYACDDFYDPETTALYIQEVISWESRFASAGIGYDEATGLAFDGHEVLHSNHLLDGYRTLNFTSPSQESIHISLITLAINGNPQALLFFDNNLESIFQLLHRKLSTYETFHANNPGYGCFLSWMDIFTNNGTIAVTSSWQRVTGSSSDGIIATSSAKAKTTARNTRTAGILPAAQNGLWFWSLYALNHVLQRVASTNIYAESQLDWHQLASRVNAIVNCQKANAKYVFYRGKGKVSATAYVLDPTVQPNRLNYAHCDGELSDHWEGDPMLRLLELFADWDSSPEQWERGVNLDGDLRDRPQIEASVVDPDGRRSIHRERLQSFSVVSYPIPVSIDGTDPLGGASHTDVSVAITRGYWLAAHEQWKLLLLPYMSPYSPPSSDSHRSEPDGLALSRQALINLEKARTWDARRKGKRGLFTSLSDALEPTTNRSATVQSVSADIDARGLELPELRTESFDIYKEHYVSPSAAFPLFLLDPIDKVDSEGWALPSRRAGFCWYNHMLQAPAMQSSLGALESISMDGRKVTPLRTWEANILPVLAMLGGIANITKQALIIDRVRAPGGFSTMSAYERFVELVDIEYRSSFGHLWREMLDETSNAQLVFAVPDHKRNQWPTRNGVQGEASLEFPVDWEDPDC